MSDTERVTPKSGDFGQHEVSGGVEKSALSKTLFKGFLAGALLFNSFASKPDGYEQGLDSKVVAGEFNQLNSIFKDYVDEVDPKKSKDNLKIIFLSLVKSDMVDRALRCPEMFLGKPKGLDFLSDIVRLLADSDEPFLKEDVVNILVENQETKILLHEYIGSLWQWRKVPFLIRNEKLFAQLAKTDKKFAEYVDLSVKSVAAWFVEQPDVFVENYSFIRTMSNAHVLVEELGAKFLARYPLTALLCGEFIKDLPNGRSLAKSELERLVVSDPGFVVASSKQLDNIYSGPEERQYFLDRAIKNAAWSDPEVIFNACLAGEKISEDNIKVAAFKSLLDKGGLSAFRYMEAHSESIPWAKDWFTEWIRVKPESIFYANGFFRSLFGERFDLICKKALQKLVVTRPKSIIENADILLSTPYEYFINEAVIRSGEAPSERVSISFEARLATESKSEFVELANNILSKDPAEASLSCAKVVLDLQAGKTSGAYIMERLGLQKWTDGVVAQLNENHNQNDDMRFEVLQSLSSMQLYALLACAEHAYTTTEIGIVDTFLKKMTKDGSADFLFFGQGEGWGVESVVEKIARHGRLSSLFTKLSSESQKKILGAFFREDKSSLDWFYAAQILGDNAKENPQIIYLVRDELDALELRLEGFGGISQYEKMCISLAREQMDASVFDVAGVWHSEVSQASPLVEIIAVPNDPSNETLLPRILSDIKEGATSFVEKRYYYRAAYHDAGSKREVVVYINKPKEEALSFSNIAADVASAGQVIKIAEVRGHSYDREKMLGFLPSTCQVLLLGPCGSQNQFTRIVSAFPNLIAVSATANEGEFSVNAAIANGVRRQVLDFGRVDFDKLSSDVRRRFPMLSSGYEMGTKQVAQVNSIKKMISQLYTK